MTVPARFTLRQPFREDRPGVTFNSLHARGSWHADAFPIRLFDGADGEREYVMHGTAWEIRLWDLSFTRFPVNESWRRAVDRTFDWIFSAGGRVAWIGDGLAYSNPPRLFEPAEMSRSVLEARTSSGLVLGEVDLDRPAAFVPDEELLALRTDSGGLAAAR